MRPRLASRAAKAGGRGISFYFYQKQKLFLSKITQFIQLF
jgi:hypothetical protein